MTMGFAAAWIAIMATADNVGGTVPHADSSAIFTLQ
jgi:hypothetical protein